MTLSDRRAAILKETIARFHAAETPIDADPILRGWLEEWVDGGLKMSDIAQRYQDLLKARLVASRESTAIAAGGDPLDLPDHHKLMNQHQLLEEVARLLAEKD